MKEKAQSPNFTRCFKRILKLAVNSSLASLALVVGCTNIPKAELESLRTHCPNLRNAYCKELAGGGVALDVRIKTASKDSLEADSARALKNLAASTNLSALSGMSGRTLTAIDIHRTWPWPTYHYALDTNRIVKWSDVRKLSNEELTRLARRVGLRDPDCCPPVDFASTAYDSWIPPDFASLKPKDCHKSVDIPHIQMPNGHRMDVRPPPNVSHRIEVRRIDVPRCHR